ncbi:hypothetical protein VUR80DRAFT_7778 [Thermomyces stellatus]
MDVFPIHSWSLLALALLPAMVLAGQQVWKSRPSFLPSSPETPCRGRPADQVGSTKARRDVPRGDGLQRYKQLYFKLHNLEHHPDVISEAKTLLLYFLSDGVQNELEARHAHVGTTILSLEEFSAANLYSFVDSELSDVTGQWRHYVARRAEGGPRELFADASDARRWLVRHTPLKFVDGAWLGHVHKITTPFALRRITKAAWQILSEELGDGDLAKCHAYVYAQLLRKVGAPAPAPDSEAFLRHPGMDDPAIWRSAVTQLLISLFPNEFLPEILGFNLNFEMMTLETLMASKELREVGIDPYYFSLHITIDNADSGHTAMAARIVAEYIGLAAAREGDAAARQAWKRVQAGFCLSKNMHRSPDGPGPDPVLNDKVTEIFLAKSVASRGVHEHCPARIAGRSLAAWLDPALFRQREWQVDFLRCLSDAKPWVYKGDSGRSRILTQLNWGGSMFGAFTDREVAVVRAWVDSLGAPGATAYEEFTGRTMADSLLKEAPKRSPAAPDIMNDLQTGDVSSAMEADPGLPDTSKLDVRKLLPLWFAHSCLLESCIAVPWNVATPTGCAIVRLLRAQHGFLPEPVGVDGLDEMARDDHTDLVDVGMDMLFRADRGCPAPESLGNALAMWPSPFAEKMLAAAARPAELMWVLLGLARAFVELHGAVALAEGLLSDEKRAALASMAEREKEALDACAGLGRGSSEEAGFRRGYLLGVREIKACTCQ